MIKYEPSECISDLIVKRNPSSGKILDFYEDFKITNYDEETSFSKFDEDLFDPGGNKIFFYFKLFAFFFILKFI